MNWTNIRLIAARELRDQLRDRRTIFVIAVLPLLLYPLLGMSFLQVAQFLQQHPTKVWVVGAADLPNAPALFAEDGQTFHVDVLSSADEAALFDLDTKTVPASGDFAAEANAVVQTGKYDTVVYFPAAFAKQLQAYAESTDQPLDGDVGPEVFFNQAKDKSRVARDRVVAILAQWRSRLVQQTLTEQALPAHTAKPFVVASRDASAESGRRAAVWSKILPFIILIWAMTGAFYPAIDLCAGEKERGTLETLLSCPASREEIVYGKLFTVMVFSIATSLLNLASLGFTGRFVMSQLHALGGGLQQVQLGPPPLTTLFWVVAILIPIAALFSALSLALAAMARSSKEGQYYLMPLMLGTMPLMMLPMMPSMELDLGNALIPVTGVVLLLRSLIAGQYMVALQFALPVIAVTGICCWLALLWAIHQFQDESVLFHESEQFSVKAWVLHIVRDRGCVPTVAQAFLCGIAILILRFFCSMWLPLADSWSGLFWQTAAIQIGCIAGPAIVMAWLLTRDVSQTLLLRRPRALHVGLMALLAVAMHPLVATFARGVSTLYPIPDSTIAKLEAFQHLLDGAPSLGHLLILIAVLPAICEELAFRGFMLSGLRRLSNPWLAILISSLFFGVAHQLLQQSISAFAVGMLIGYLSLKTNSIFPCMAYHLVHNSLPLLAANWITNSGGIPGLAEIHDGTLCYGWPLVSLSAAAATLILLRLRQQDDGPSETQPTNTLCSVPSV